jgi:hypothetical protein
MRRFTTGLLILVSAVCLLASSHSLWTRHNVINTQVFVSNVETIVDLPQVEARVNQKVTDTVMANPDVQAAVDNALALLPPRLQQFRPTVENGIRTLISTGVQRLLTSDPFRPLTAAAVTSAHTQLVNGQPVQFTLGQAKARIPASLKDGLAGQVLGLLPDNLGFTIVTPADAPQLYNTIDLFKSVWWWLGLIALAALAGALGISRRRRSTLRAWSVTTTVLVLIELMALRLARGQVVVAAKAENRDAVGAVYDVLAQSLRSWTLWLLALVLVVLVATLVWGRLGLVAGLRRGWASVRQQAAHRHEQQAAATAATAGAGGALEAGGAPGEVAAVPVPESWPHRVAADTRAFTQGLELDRRVASLGSFVREHRKSAQWTGIVVGAVVLLFWPSPTLRVLIWIVAVIALYLGALEWLQARATQEAAAEPLTSGVGEEPAAVTAIPAPRAAQRDAALVPTGVGATSRAEAPALPVPSDGAPSGGVPSGGVPSGGAPGEARADLSDRLDLLLRLGAARDSGVLTDEEFAREKARLVSS